jgi:chemotaxis protein histidine kinase CheA
MAEKKTIELEVKSNLGESISDLKALKRQLKDTAAGSEEFKKIFNQIDDLEDKIKSAKNTSSDWIDSLESAGGPIGALGASLNRAKVATQSFGGALKATGIGLVVALIGGLVAAFQENEVAMKKLQPLLDGIGKLFQGVFRAVEPLFNTLVDLAVSALPTVSKAFGVVYSSVTAVFQSLGLLGGAIKKLISGDFSGAWQDAKSSVNDFSKNYDASIKRFNEGTKEMSKTEKEEAEKRAEARKKAQEKKEQDQEKAKQTAIEKAKAEADALKKIEEDRIAAEMASAQEVMDKEKALREAQETPAQKEEREYQEWLTKYQANNLNTELLDKQHKDNLSLIAKTDAEKKAADDKIISDKIAADKKASDDKEVEFQKNKDTAIANSKANLNNIIAGLEASGLAKTKSGQIISKAIALTQIGIDSAVAISKASTLANAEGVAAQLAFPLVPGIGTIARVVSYASTAATVVGNIARAKQLLSSGGGGGGGSAPSGGGSAPSGGGGAAPAAPAFNVVGASSTNQLAQTIGNQQQQPIKAYVVANDVTTQQSLDRNIVSSASIG